MKLPATLVLCLVLAVPAVAGVVHDEAADGDISSDPQNPTQVTFAVGSNLIINGTIGNLGSPADVRDYITFTIPPGEKLSHLGLNKFSPDNLCFSAFNTGTFSYIANATTNPLFLSGIHVQGADAGTDILPRFVDRPVTQNGLSAPELGPGDYCFLIQQTSAILSTYELDFVVDVSTPARTTTWGRLRSLYR
jgi:hypothetical protein